MRTSQHGPLDPTEWKSRLDRRSQRDPSPRRGQPFRCASRCRHVRNKPLRYRRYAPVVAVFSGAPSTRNPVGFASRRGFFVPVISNCEWRCNSRASQDSAYVLASRPNVSRSGPISALNVFSGLPTPFAAPGISNALTMSVHGSV